MLFNSLEYILAFLPVVVTCYFFLNTRGYHHAALNWLVIASLFFYGYWNPRYIFLIITSILINFTLGELIQKNRNRFILITGLVFNLGLLAYFKYANFIVNNINVLLKDTSHFINIPTIELPLAISFFTFLQIAYLVDCHQGKVKETRFLHYTLFVTYFPHLIAGPLVHHQELMPEFSKPQNKPVQWPNIYIGLFIFSLGLFKKVFIADTFSQWAKLGFDSSSPLNFFDAWGASLSYTLQLYFDFSGYTDMAIGASTIMNIKLPINFNSPYKALNIQDFWRRWHITLSRWLKEYLYIPLGGNRHGSFFTGCNLFITFLLGGLWHGANWNFVLWGALHGTAVVTHRIWQAANIKIFRYMAWLITFLFVNVAWVFFRAKTLDDTKRVLHGMVDINSAHISESFANSINYFTQEWPLLHLKTAATVPHLLPISTLIFIVVFFPLCLIAPNSHEIAHRMKLSDRTLSDCICLAVLAGIPLYIMLYLPSHISEFIYFHF